MAKELQTPSKRFQKKPDPLGLLSEVHIFDIFIMTNLCEAAPTDKFLFLAALALLDQTSAS